MLGVCVLLLPVQGYVVSRSIYSFDDQRITISYCQCWSRKLPINRDSFMGSAQPLHWYGFNLFQNIILCVSQFHKQAKAKAQ